MNNRSTGLLTTLHALVDALCACCVFLIEPSMEFEASILLFVAYNTLAFVTQPLVGWWLDRNHHDVRHLLAAIALLSIGGLLTITDITRLSAVPPFLIVTLVGLGNSLFHVYGGKFVSESTGNDLRHLGIFVSSGALGLAIGGQYASMVTLCLILTFLIILTIAYVYSIRYKADGPGIPLKKQAKTIKDNSNRGKTIRWLIAFIVLIVFIRSFLGSMLPSGVGQSIPYFAVFSIILAVSGKASGGFIAHKSGVWTTLITVLLLAGIFFLLGHYHDAFLLVMVFLINCSMPITLHLSNRLLTGRQGFSFGLLAAVLAPGVGLAKMCQDSPLAYDLLYPLIATIVIEMLVLLLLHEHRWQVLTSSVVMNILTNIPLNLLALFCIQEFTIPAILLLEAGVMVIESIYFLVVTHNWRQSVVYSLLCNCCSYGCGLLFEIFFL